MGVAVSMAEALAAVVSTEEASTVALSMVAGFAVAILAGATGMAAGTITNSLMMSSSAASGIRAGGAGIIRMDITASAITRTITMATAITHTATTDTADMVTVAMVMAIAMEAERVMDMAMAAEPVTHIALAANQGMSGVRGVGDKSVTVWE